MQNRVPGTISVLKMWSYESRVENVEHVCIHIGEWPFDDSKDSVRLVHNYPNMSAESKGRVKGDSQVFFLQ